MVVRDAAAVLNIGLGLASWVMPGRRLWLIQMAVVLGYSLTVALAMPEFLVHPFGPIVKHVALLALLAALFAAEPQ